MDMPATNEIRNFKLESFNTADHLANATRQAHQRKYQDFLIVDVDAHHYESESYKEVFQYIASPVVKHTALESVHRAGRASFMGGEVGYQDTGGRMTRHWQRKLEKTEGPRHRDITMTLRWVDAMGVDYCCLFPTPMLFLGTHPQPEIEAELAMAYNRWLCERVLANEPRIISMLYLPFNDPDAAYRCVQEFGDKKGVVGFMVTSPRYKPVHDNAYIKTYSLLEEMNLPLSFHAAYSWNEQSLSLQNRFIGVHALGFMWFNMVHMTNWIVNGMPERFPKLRTMWIESGLTWAYCLAQRLDHSYMMRTSECPSLKRKPSEYMQDMYFSTQPMEMPEDKSILEATFKMIKAETQLCWASDY
ncbi:MAG: amidohydrolase family protein, partial [Hyphomicrobiaceae bacterium]